MSNNEINNTNKSRFRFVSTLFKNKYVRLLILSVSLCCVLYIVLNIKADYDIKLHLSQVKMELDTTETYLTGTLDESIEKTKNCIRYYETNRAELEKPHNMVWRVYSGKSALEKGHFDDSNMTPVVDIGTLDVDMKIRRWRFILAYLYLFKGDADLCYQELSMFYEGASTKIPRSQVMQKFLDEFELINGVSNWKTNHPLDTNVFRAVNDMFITNAAIVSDGKK